MKRLIFSLFTLLFTTGVSMADTEKPWTFWYWMYGAVTEQGIKADLKAMKDVGLGGCYLMPIRGSEEHPEYQGQANAMSDNFWKMVDCALEQADELNLDMGIHVCDGFALAGGPWIKPEESMQKIVFCDTIVRGGHHRFQMPKPAHYKDYYQDIAVYAYPVSDVNVETFAMRYADLQQRYPLKGNKKVTCSPELTVNDKGVYCADSPCWIQYELPKPVMIFTVEIEPSGNNIQCQRLTVKASDDGVVFHEVTKLTPPRQGWQNTGYNTSLSIPPTRAKYFRLEWTPAGTEPGAEDLDAAKWKPVLRVKDIHLCTLPVVNSWEGKTGLVWRDAPDMPDNYLNRKQRTHYYQIHSNQIKGDVVDVNLIGGTWRILRMGYTSTGHTNATAGGGKGLECDKFSRKAVEKQIENWFGKFMERPHHDVIKYMHIDSWECGSQNWSPTFASEFARRRGYNLLPVLPVMAGVPIDNAEIILRDVRQTIEELKNEAFFATVTELAHKYGVQVSSECVAPTMMSNGMKHFLYTDIPMGEFWLNSPTHDKPNDMLDAISGAHIYGKNIIQAEGFTEVRGVWNETPAMVKPLLDRNFALGMNRLFFHVNTHNPWLDKKPGMTLDGIGLFFQRDQTWFAEAKGFVKYITRCQELLQKGQPVVDIAIYTGEDLPVRAFTPDKVVKMLPGIFGAQRVAAEKARLENVGQPMVESPVGVNHSAGILDLKDWINPLHGYQYDSMDRYALLYRPFNYKALVIPEGVLLSSEVKKRINELRKQGVLIIDKPYEHALLEGISPDVNLPEGIAYTHRSDNGQEIYFLSNQTDQTQTFSPTFRQATGKGIIYSPQADDKYVFQGTLTLAPYESVFVIYGSSMNVKAYAKERVKVELEEDGGNTYDITFKESKVTLKKQSLFDWSQHANDKVRYFSGHARYTTKWNVKNRKAVKNRAWIAFPDVKDIAHVWVNGKDCGYAWTYPYEVEVTGALKKGSNKIEIEVVNTWHNALKGLDAGKAPYEGIWTNAKYRTKGDALLPAGLIAQPELIVEK